MPLREKELQTSMRVVQVDSKHYIRKIQHYAMQQYVLIDSADNIQISHYSPDKDHYNGVKFIYICLEILPHWV